MRVIATVVMGFLLLLLESVFVGLFDVEIWLPHIAVGLMVFLALERELTEGAAEVVLLAWAADLLAASSPGVLAMALSLTYLLMKASTARLSYKSRLSRGVLAIVACLLVQALSVIIMMVLGVEGHLWGAFLWSGMPSALSAPIGFVLASLALRRSDAFFRPRRKGLLRE